MRLFGRKKNEKQADYSLSVTITLEPIIPYPDIKEERMEKYGNPLSAIFEDYYENIGVAYYRNNQKNEMLEAIELQCHDPKFSNKKSDEQEFSANFFTMYSKAILEFFEPFGIKAHVSNVQNISYSLEDFVTAFEKLKLNPESIENTEGSKAGSDPKVMINPSTGKSDLIINLGKQIDLNDMSTEGMTIQKHDDGRYFASYISKKDKKRYFIHISEEMAKDVLKKK